MPHNQANLCGLFELCGEQAFWLVVAVTALAIVPVTVIPAPAAVVHIPLGVNLAAVVVDPIAVSHKAVTTRDITTSARTARVTVVDGANNRARPTR